ncbi:MAG: hypothetical protein K2Y39_15950 [Candidatus Obscuribacterales bacterium]|nr:hypothetical protein [Candidatus Obscuribacterales bacterium]
MTALIILANVVLFLAASALGFYMLGTIGDKLIGFQTEARAMVFTEGDRKSLWRYRWLSLGVMGTFTKGSGLLMLLMGWSLWSTFALAPTIGGVLGVLVCYWLTAGNLKPHRDK